ncbi:CHAT domain-containing protein [Candidatus Binatia bacterium]|nr:CHAT domain-containing protein [Candidatus Binatia bacterium]
MLSGPLESVTIELQRFGDPAGILRLSDRYIRTIGISAPADEVSFKLPQENLTEAMKRLDYDRFVRAGDTARDDAEEMLRGLAPFVTEFLFGPSSLPPVAGGLQQIDVVARPLELAQLPFEVIEEARTDVVVTRRVRRAWPPPTVVEGQLPKVLFAWAAPRRMDVPHARHRELLEEILRDLGDADALVEVPHATRAKLEAILGGEQRFTQVHLLAHGVAPRSAPIADPFDLAAKPVPTTRLALETDDGELDACAAAELAAWLARGPRPQVLTIAACHSGEVDPVCSGGTLAHTLHAEGIPIVLASQLALTKDGSEILLSHFLKQIIEGEDPRLALRGCRNALRERRDKTYYDRIALVGYVHVDADLAERCKERRFKVALRHLQAISAEARRRIEQAIVDLSPTRDLTAEQTLEADRIAERFEEVRRRLAGLEPDQTLSKAQLEELRGLRASSLKREAQAAWRLAGSLRGPAAEKWIQRSRSALRQATGAYECAARVSRDHHWNWVQWLVLLAIEGGDELRSHWVDWTIAEIVSREVAERSVPADLPARKQRDLRKDAIWARGSLCELYLLAPLFGQPPALEKAKSCLDALVAGCRLLDDREAIEATCEQLKRYMDWWGADPTCSLPRSVIEDADELRHHLDGLERS